MLMTLLLQALVILLLHRHNLRKGLCVCAVACAVMLAMGVGNLPTLHNAWDRSSGFEYTLAEIARLLHR